MAFPSIPASPASTTARTTSSRRLQGLRHGNLTWDRFIEIGKDVKAKTGHEMMALDSNDGGLIRIMMQSGGQWYFNEDGSLNITGNAH